MFEQIVIFSQQMLNHCLNVMDVIKHDGKAT